VNSSRRDSCINPRAARQLSPQFPQLDSYIFDRLISVFGVFRQTSPHDSLQVIWRVGSEVADRRNRLTDNLVKRINRVLAFERPVAGHRLKQDAPEREDV